MRYVSTPAQDDLRAQVRAFLAEASPPAEVRRLMETDQGFDPSVWDEIVAAGWIDLPVADLAIVVEGAGAALLCAPLLGTAIVRAAGIGASGSIVALAVAEDSGRWDPAAVDLRATPAGREWRLDGHKGFVVDGHTADTLVVAGRTPTGVALFEVDADAAGLTRHLLPTVDPTRKQARIELAAAPARLVGDDADLDRALAVAATLLAAEQVGGAQRCLDMTVAHARRRVQFGRPIGTFQAVQHRCADMLLEVESARSAAAWAVETFGTDAFPRAAAAAKVTCSEAYAFVATETVHLHGGLGFTWDHDAHLYFKRARSSRLLFGDPGVHRERLFRLLGL